MHLFYSKIVQIESKTKSSKLDFAVFPNRSIKVVKVLKILTLPPPQKNKNGRKLSLPPACSVFKKDYFTITFLTTLSARTM